MTLTDQLARLHADAQTLVRMVDAVCECADSTIAAMRADLNDALMRVSRTKDILADERAAWSWLYAERSWIATQLMDYTPQLEWLLAEARWWADEWQSIGRACVIDEPEPFPWETPR